MSATWKELHILKDLNKGKGIVWQTGKVCQKKKEEMHVDKNGKTKQGMKTAIVWNKGNLQEKGGELSRALNENANIVKIDAVLKGEPAKNTGMW